MAEMCLEYASWEGTEICGTWFHGDRVSVYPALGNLSLAIINVSLYSRVFSLANPACRDAAYVFACANWFYDCDDSAPPSASNNTIPPCLSLCEKFLNACAEYPTDPEFVNLNCSAYNLPKGSSGEPCTPESRYPLPVNLSLLTCPHPFLPTEPETQDTGPACAYPCRDPTTPKSRTLALAIVNATLAIVSLACVLFYGMHTLLFVRRFPECIPAYIICGGLNLVAWALLLPLFQQFDFDKTFCKSPTEVSDASNPWCAATASMATVGVQYANAWWLVWAVCMFLTVMFNVETKGRRWHLAAHAYTLGYTACICYVLYARKILYIGLNMCSLGEGTTIFWNVWFAAVPAAVHSGIVLTLVSIVGIKLYRLRNTSNKLRYKYIHAVFVAVMYAAFAPLCTMIIIFYIVDHKDEMADGVREWIKCLLYTPDSCPEYPENQMPFGYNVYVTVESGLLTPAMTFVLFFIRSKNRALWGALFRRIRDCIRGRMSFGEIFTITSSDLLTQGSSNRPKKTTTSQAYSRRTADAPMTRYDAEIPLSQLANGRTGS